MRTVPLKPDDEQAAVLILKHREFMASQRTQAINALRGHVAKLKALLKNVATRTRDDLWNAKGDALPQFTPADCANYSAATGYEPDDGTLL